MAAKADKPARVKDPNEGRKVVILLVGLVAALVGLGLVGYGLAPAAAFGELMSMNPSSDITGTIEKAMADLKARAWADVVGMVLLFAGIIAVKVAMKPPKPKTVEQLVQEEVDRRMAALGPVGQPGQGGASSSPSTAVSSGVASPGLSQTLVQAAAASPSPAPRAEVVTTSSGHAFKPSVAPDLTSRPAVSAARRCAWCSTLLGDAKRCQVCGNKA